MTYHQKHLDIALQLGDKGGEEKHTATLVEPITGLETAEKLTNYQKHLDIALQLGDKVVREEHTATLVSP